MIVSDPPHLQGGLSYQGSPQYPGLYSEVEGAVFQCTTSPGWAIVINKRQNEHILTKLSVDTFGNHMVELQSGYVLSPNALNSDVVNLRIIPVVELSSGTVQLPPYSVVMFKLSE